MSISPQKYCIYGMVVESDVTFPELLPLSDQSRRAEGTPDVTIRSGDVPRRLFPHAHARATVMTLGDTCLLRIPDAGNFLVRPDSIVFEQLTTASMDDVRTYLLGTVLACVAHLRKLVPVHVSAVLSPSGAIAFTGDSGAGKSTIAAHINRATQWPLISDDVSAVFQSENEFSLESGVLTVKLWKDALASLNRTSDGLKRDAERLEKFHAIDSEKFVVGRFPLKRLIYLEWGDDERIETVTGRAALKIALSSVYRPEFSDLCRNRHNVVTRMISLTNQIHIQKLTRRKGVPVADGIANSLKIADLLGQ